VQERIQRFHDRCIGGHFCRRLQYN
jgi:hypothetical protein